MNDFIKLIGIVVSVLHLLYGFFLLTRTARISEIINTKNFYLIRVVKYIYILLLILILVFIIIQ